MVERIIDIVSELFRDPSEFRSCLDLMDTHLESLDSDDLRDAYYRIFVVVNFLEEFLDE